MTSRQRSASLLLLALLFCETGSLRAGWNKLLQLPNRQQAGCGFFFDADHGLIGTGYRNVSLSAPKIYYTNDGGKTWTVASTPGNFAGAVTSIIMKDLTTGYASFYSNGGGGNNI